MNCHYCKCTVLHYDKPLTLGLLYRVVLQASRIPIDYSIQPHVDHLYRLHYQLYIKCCSSVITYTALVQCLDMAGSFPTIQLIRNRLQIWTVSLRACAVPQGEHTGNNYSYNHEKRFTLHIKYYNWSFD